MLEVFDPTGAAGSTKPHAARLASLDGRRIGLLSNNIWQAPRTHALLREELARRFPTARFELVTAGEQVQADAVIDAIVKEGFDAVVVGNAA